MEFCNITKENSVKMNDFCGKFIDENDLLTNLESDTVLTLMLECLRDYKRKRPVDQERVKKLAKMLNDAHRNADQTKVCKNSYITSAYELICKYRKQFLTVHTPAYINI